MLFLEDEILGRVLEDVSVCEASNRGDIYYHYKLGDMEDKTMSETTEKEQEEPRFSCQILPTVGLKETWSGLYFEHGEKQVLLNYVSTMIITSNSSINLRVFDLHKIILLYGPPGCGKTSLCKALAQKIGVRAAQLTSTPTTVKLIEVNCHSLFSKWFSESGKQIKEMFDDVRRLALAPGTFVCILIDEIESISISRTSLFKGSEPSDSIRAVNVLLTQIDQIRELPNVLIMATSNLPETVDPAFMDRVDRKFRLGPPSRRAKYEIVMSGLRELASKGMLEDMALLRSDDEFMQAIDTAIEGSSGRLVRKLPFLALSESLLFSAFPVPCKVFMDALRRIVQGEPE